MFIVFAPGFNERLRELATAFVAGILGFAAGGVGGKP